MKMLLQSKLFKCSCVLQVRLSVGSSLVGAEVLKNDQKKFEEKFEALNSDESHFCNRNDICTPMGCVREMVDAIPKSFWRRKCVEVLDPCAGNGNFHAYIRNFVPLENLTFNEINPARIANIRRLFGDKVQVTKKDFLNYDDQKQYDLIVSQSSVCDVQKRQACVKKSQICPDSLSRKPCVSQNRTG